MPNTPHRPELNALFNLPPVDAIDYLKSKGFKLGWDWHETLDDAHSRAFTVAKVAKIDLLQDIRKSLITALEQGQNLEQWKADLIPTLQKKGWWGKQTVMNPEGIEQTVQLGSHRRLRTIYDTNMQSAFSAGRYKAMKAAADTRPFWEWRHITMVNYRPYHLALNGRTFRHDDAFWHVAFPPSEFGCKCRVIARSAREVEGKEILSSDGYSKEVYEKVGTNRLTGAEVMAKRTEFNIPLADGNTLNFKPAAGFNSSPASSYLLDKVLIQRATDLMGTAQGLQQVQQLLTATPRLKAHEAFVSNSLSFAKPQNKTSTVGVIGAQEIAFLTAKGQAVESPIMTISDHLMVGKKSVRHDAAGNAPTIEEWHQLPLLVSKAEYVLWDVDNDSFLFILPSFSANKNEVIKMSARNRNGVIEVVSIFKVGLDAVLGNVKSGLYIKIR